jgi:hypothetical protein
VNLPPHLQEAEQRFQEQISGDLEGAIAQYQQRFGNIIDRDNARELFPEYSQSRESRQALGPATYRPAGILADELYRRAVVQPDPTGSNLVVFNAGGPGVGKSTGVSGNPVDAQIIMDGTLSNYAKSRINIQTALDNGKDVAINYTQRSFAEALRNIIERAADPNNGRIVSAPMAAQGRILARENVLKLAEEHAGNPSFTVRAVDNTGNRGRSVSLEELRHQAPESLDDLRARAQAFINAYFREHAAGNPALTDALRKRIIG